MSIAKYHNPDTCNKCGQRSNTYNGHTLQNDEFDTRCVACGHEDHWAYGFFESNIDGFDSCDKYVNDNGTLRPARRMD